MTQAALDIRTAPNIERRVIRSFNNYQEAERAVDYLADNRFPVDKIAIVAEGLKFVEEVTGPLLWYRLLLDRAGTGATIGALLGFFFGTFNFFQPIVSAIYLAFSGLLAGALVGAIFGLIEYAFSSGQRDFTSMPGIQADSYSIVAEESVAEKAKIELQTLQ